MLRRTLLAALTMAASIASGQNKSPAVDEVIQKYVDAIGGLEKLRAVRTLKMTGKAMLGEQTNAPMTLQLKRPASSRLDMEIQGQNIVQAFDGTTGWMLMPFRNPAPEKANSEETQQMRENSDMDGPLVDYRTKGNQVELLGTEDVAGTSTYKIKVARKGGHTEVHYINASSFLPLKNVTARSQNGTSVEIESYPRDFRKVGGILLPYTIEQKANGKTVMRMVMERIEVNVPVDDDIFKMPPAEKR